MIVRYAAWKGRRSRIPFDMFDLARSADFEGMAPSVRPV